jgi:hypothetical protein
MHPDLYQKFLGKKIKYHILTYLIFYFTYCWTPQLYISSLTRYAAMKAAFVLYQVTKYGHGEVLMTMAMYWVMEN